MRTIVQTLIAFACGATVAYGYIESRRRPRYYRRHELFLTEKSGTQIGISSDLLQSAHILLANALEERKGGVWRSRENHATHYAPGVIVAIVTSLDAWLNELIGVARIPLSLTDDLVADVINISSVPEKYEDVAHAILHKKLRASSALKLLAKVRNEIVHFLPYAQNVSSKTVPDWLQALEQQQLLIATTKKSVDFHFSQKLGSYALAYWACDTAFRAANDLEIAAQNNAASFMVRAYNFSLYQQITRPPDLIKFDQQFGLTLTP